MASSSDVPALVAAVTARLMSRAAPPSVPPAIYAFQLTEGGIFHIVVTNGSARAGAGLPPGPADATITISGDDAAALLEDRLNPVMAFMSGRIKVRGDTAAAMRLGDLLR